MHDHLIHPNTEPLTVAGLNVGEGRIEVDFVTEHPTHRHLHMAFEMGENQALDRCLEHLAEVVVAAATKSMLDIVGGAVVPDDPGALIPNWQCRICDVVAPALTPGWIQVSKDDAAPRAYCPDHVNCS